MKIITLETVSLISVDAIVRTITDYLLSINQRCDRLLIICEDVTRSTPIDLFFAQLLAFINRSLSPEITVIFALGTHRP
ncbi:lactate racemase domain-containing protein, partial [Arthrospira platensis SPKY2]